jgi:hypothetical protein
LARDEALWVSLLSLVEKRVRAASQNCFEVFVFLELVGFPGCKVRNKKMKEIVCFSPRGSKPERTVHRV